MKKNVFASTAVRISFFSVLVNLLLVAIKLAAGVFGHSQALVADAVHSASDVLSTFIVIASLIISARAADAGHEYGHQKFESLASLILGIILVQVGVKLGVNGVNSIRTGTYLTAAAPSWLTAAAALLSILVKEAMYRVTMAAAKKENSSALKADAWHHRSDALSSIGSLVGVLFAMFGLPIMDSIASIVICIFILKTAAEIIIEAAKALTDSSCGEKTEEAIRQEALSVPGVQSLDLLKTRMFGSGYYVDLEIRADGALSLREAHGIAERVHDRIEKSFPAALHCMVHVNPCGGAESASCGSLGK